MRRAQRKQCLKVMRQTFGVDAFRPGQEAAVGTLLAGRDLLCIMPTGAGKSLCYQLPAVLGEGMTLVISPLIALMQDQVDSLLRRNIPAQKLTHLESPAQREHIMHQVAAGKLKLLYVSPERLQSQAFRRQIQATPPARVVIDEAHCIVRWGRDFRPAYSAIGDFIASLPARPVLCAMTATADDKMQREIIKRLQMKHPRRIVMPVVRENLTYSIIGTLDRDAELRRLAGNLQTGRMIVYCSTRRCTEAVAQLLRRQGLQALHYHAGMDEEARRIVQQSFTEGACNAVAATIAFGMGVDVPDVRLVVHDALPTDVLAYAQETGRAGRDGKPACCVLLLDPAALEQRRWLIASTGADRGKPFIARKAAMLRLARDTRRLLILLLGKKCIRSSMSAAFGWREPPCGKCPRCMGASDGAADRVPSLWRLSRSDLALWVLQRHRAVLEKRGAVHHVTDEALMQAVRTGLVPDSVGDEAQQRLQCTLNNMQCTTFTRH